VFRLAHLRIKGDARAMRRPRNRGKAMKGRPGDVSVTG